MLNHQPPPPLQSQSKRRRSHQLEPHNDQSRESSDRLQFSQASSAQQTSTHPRSTTRAREPAQLSGGGDDVSNLGDAPQTRTRTAAILEAGDHHNNRSLIESLQPAFSRDSFQPKAQAQLEKEIERLKGELRLRDQTIDSLEEKVSDQTETIVDLKEQLNDSKIELKCFKDAFLPSLAGRSNTGSTAAASPRQQATPMPSTAQSTTQPTA